MELSLRELCVARICSGSIRLKVMAPRGKEAVILVKKPSREATYIANEVYHDVFEEAQMDGLHSEESLLDFLVENDLWDEEKERLLKALPGEIDEFKVKLFEATFRSDERKAIRKALGIAKTRLAELVEQRNAHVCFSCSGAASIAKSRYLIGSSLYYATGRKVFVDDTFWDQSSVLLDNVMVAISRNRLDDGVFRELARTEPWRSIWNARKVEGSVFGVPVIDFTDEQKALTNWSLLYDSIFQHPECPGDDTLEDDDLVDGWMIVQRRKREQQNTQNADGLLKNEAIRNSDEVFIPVGSVEDAKKVHNLNDKFVQSTVRQRFAHLAKHGTVDEVNMPDTRKRLQMEATQLLSQHLKGK